ncbi:TIGR01777 family oxidoreductase [Actinacidiphila glaucinigra]|uniref:TIGR01777 family oxidoreductase n=1 Tax=Actinacidiphila glaucinigra TaxID=235986 RepID=UPI002DDA76EC|nr:TIGR01777 family oxidoreductase [Actinacidiphila glaucinigra]WSD62530.1 TIGR01777 family oxidoreductase [Actinacidiphila glaucinigra]
MRIAITGSSGLIGSALVRSLRSDRHEVVRLVRREPSGPDEVRWDPQGGTVDTTRLAGVEAVVHLAGAGVGDHRWTDDYKRTIRDSRVRGTDTLARALASLGTPPRVLVSGSGITAYGDTGDRRVDESSPLGTGFLPSVCRDWEAAADPAREAGVRTAFARTGLVVSGRGGAWGRLFPLFKAGLGGRLGDGRQYWSFISLHDHIAALRHIIGTESVSGPVNLCAPEPLTNAEVTRAMGRVLRRPTVFAVPGPVLRAAVGEFATEILGSTRAVPRVLLDSGFTYTHPGIDEAIRAALAEERH